MPSWRPTLAYPSLWTAMSIRTRDATSGSPSHVLRHIGQVTVPCALVAAHIWKHF